jgi:membrane protease YdiL (CAAX protease family)
VPGATTLRYDRAVPRTIAIALPVVALVIAVAVSLARVASLESREVAAEGPWMGSSTARLVEARIFRGHEVVFELCSEDPMDPASWLGAGSVALVRRDGTETMFARAIDAELLGSARRSARGACATFGHVDRLDLEEESIDVAIELAWDAPTLAVPVRARVIGQRGLGGLDLGIVIGALGCALLSIGVLALRVPEIADDDHRGGVLRVGTGVALLVGVHGVLGFFHGGPTIGLVLGLLLAVAEIGAAFLLIRPIGGASRSAGLALVRPADRRVAIAGLLGAPVIGFLLFRFAAWALGAVPSTGEAPVEAFVRWPSGMLSFAALAVVAPIAEEVFFRGLVYGALRGPGGTVREATAIAGAWLLFVVAHLPQVFHNWGGLVALLAAGLAFTLLRAATRSVLVSSVAHLVYNGLLAASALLAGAGPL